MTIIVLYMGSSSVKAARARRLETGAIQIDEFVSETLDRGDRTQAITRALSGLAAQGEVELVAHRVVHGGALKEAAGLTSEVKAIIARFAQVAPLHNPVALEGIEAAERLFPRAQHVAVFDTAFHAGRGGPSEMYALAPELADPELVRRHGFHGIAHEALFRAYVAQSSKPANATNAVTLQLGAGCSACTIRNGASIDISMGFSPLEGLVMATRSGDIDPALIFHWLRQGHEPEKIERALLQGSGLQGLAGTGDMRMILERVREGDETAERALSLFVHRIVKTVGAAFTLLGGHGALIFGGGIGERAVEVRRRICEALACWNVHLDPGRNDSGHPGPISRPGSRDVYVLPTDEASLIAERALAAAGA